MNRKRVHSIIENQKRSEKAIRDYHDKVKHHIMLKQELRKLKEQDIMTIKERNKRLDMIKKNQIIEKQLQTNDLIMQSKFEVEMNKKKMIENDIKDLLQKEIMASTFLNFTKGNGKIA